MWALPKLCQRLFLTGFGPCQAALPLRFPVLRGWVWIAEARSPKPSAQPRLAPAQASPTQARSAQPRPAQASPSLSVGLAKALPKAFAYWIQMWRFRPPGGIGFGPFLARLGPPCRCVWLFWRVGSGPRFCDQPSAAQPSPAQPSPAQPSPAQPSPPHLSPPQRNPAQPSPPQPSPAQPSSAQPAHTSPSAQCPAQHSPASPPKPWCGPCQSFAKGFFLPDLARVRPPCRCVSLF